MYIFIHSGIGKQQNGCNFRRTVATFKTVDPKIGTTVKNAASYDYRLLHKWTENQPRCMYALLHKTISTYSRTAQGKMLGI